ncbi:MAG: 6-hydroxymethylpterin diphosphokinase MptE-like protein [Succinivibrionaceae bacterium]
MTQNFQEINFADEISRLEKVQEQLLEQQKIDQNLREFIQERLASNMKSFRDNFPQIAKKFENFKPSGKYRLFCRENGEVNVMIEEDGKPLYEESPFEQCRYQVEQLLEENHSTGEVNIIVEDDPFGQIHFKYKNDLTKKVKEIIGQRKPLQLKNFESIPAVFMFGIGLGYPIGYLYENITPVNIFIIEPDLEMFYMSLCVFDYAPWIEFIKEQRLGVKFFLSDDENLLVKEVGEYFTKFPSVYSNKRIFRHYKTKKINSMLDALFLHSTSFNLGLGFFDDYLFGVSNSFRNIIAGHPFWLFKRKLPEKFKNYPLIIVGNGPSLDQDLPLLKKYEKKAVILACGTAYSSLCRCGIKADIYVAVERIANVYDALMAITDHREYLDDTLCIAPDVVHPKTLSLFKHIVLGFKVNEVMPRWLTAIGVLPGFKTYTLFNCINPLVSNMGLRTASLLGFNSIYLLGVDNGTADKGNAHSRFSMYYDKDGNLKKGYENMTLNYNDEFYPGNFRESVSTNSLFKTSIRVMNECVVEYPSIRYYNCSDGARVIGMEPVHFADLNWETRPDVDKKAVREFIEKKMSEPLQQDAELQMREHLYLDRFNEIVAEIKKRLRKTESTRQGFILMEDEIFSYVHSYVNHGFALAGCLLGSLSQLFTLINVALYSYSDEQKGLGKAYELISHVEEFLDHTQRIYPHILQYVQGEHLKYQEL